MADPPPANRIPMPTHHIPLPSLIEATHRPIGEWPPPSPATVVTVDLDSGEDETGAGAGPLLAGTPAVVVGLTSRCLPEDHRHAHMCDLVVSQGDPALDAAVATVEAHPSASVALAMLLRGAEDRSIDDGLLVESAVYSVLLVSPEFSTWRAARSPRRRREPGDAVSVAREGHELHVTLNRPHVRNALNTQMRDQLVDALRLAMLDDSIAEVHLRGEGEAFCAGGDLDEFGSFPDPTTAHLVRLGQSAGRHIAAMAGKVTAHLHGACVGSGIEIPAFAGRVVASPEVSIGLPELSLGLLPGAGGTVSLPRRIGRHRTARLAFTGERIDGAAALEWGLVDELT